MLISYRGHFGDPDPWQSQGGMVTEPMLRALNIPYQLVDQPAQVEKSITDALSWTRSSLHPVAVLLTRKLMWED
jgi:sulfopyruvate decarboxylase subunit alpha